jgi:hypothetical protein
LIDHLQTISNDSSIICVTESHLDENILTTDIKLPGYHEPFRNDRNCFGGGVLVPTLVSGPGFSAISLPKSKSCKSNKINDMFW